MRTLDPLLAKLAKIRLVVMDLDGTLVTANRESFDMAIRQLRRLRPLGVGFSVATGRTIQGAGTVVDALLATGARMAPTVTYNGAVVVEAETRLIVLRHTIDLQAVHEVLRRCRDLGLRPIVYACRGTVGFRAEEIVYVDQGNMPSAEFNGMRTLPVNDPMAIDDEIVAVLLETDCDCSGSVEAAIERLAAEFSGRLRFTTSGGRYVEICHPSGTKVDGLRQVARVKGIGLDEVMAIGDNFNDLDMLAGVGVGVAVANAPEIVRSSAAMVTEMKGAKGVVEAIRTLVRAQRFHNQDRRAAESALGASSHGSTSGRRSS